MREILLVAQLQEGNVVWTASAAKDGEVEYQSHDITDVGPNPKTALDALMRLTQGLYERIHALEVALNGVGNEPVH